MFKKGDRVEILNTYELNTIYKKEKYAIFIDYSPFNDDCIIRMSDEATQFINKKYIKPATNELKVEIKGDTTYVEYNGKKAISTCYGEKFDEEKGVAFALLKIFGINYREIVEAIEKSKNKTPMFKCGDIVEVVDVGKTLPRYDDFFKEIDKPYLSKFYRKDICPTQGMQYEICGDAKYNKVQKQNLYAIRNYAGQVYIISESGLKLIKEFNK